MYRVGPRDGTLIQSFVGSLVVRQAFGAPGVEYDASRLHYLGAPATDSYVLTVTRKSGVTRVEETFGPAGKPLVLGTLGPGSPLEVGSIILRDYYGANIRLVSGYDGAAKIRLALDGGEVDGMFTSWQELRGTSREKLDSGEWIVLRQAAAEPPPEIPNVPSLLDLARDDEQRQLIRLATIVPYAFARPYVVAPDVPGERVRALETAFARTMADAEFRAEAERGQLLIEPVSGEAAEKRVREFLSMPADLREKLQPIMWPL
jgi:tripartite-type tricarboxylate transporter receptor subunit TctC